ncbi:Citrate synthase protein [Neofusicoccum parvum]|uniref:Citrate synthase n=2 Tax=Neofusicoccum parvum TaxID=310453 RepID=R1GAQ5_BOTPV|nr:putative citrate synthase protein [Neofusicoccum parvum UCRNP2]GME39330.1 Citrate synthase protein [Neofusicoccum parvum]GME65887.1 Citrate synthase protein [Neofusicoccum parvum]
MATTTITAPANGRVSKDSLTVTDNRTGSTFTFPITHNAVNASNFKQIKAPEDPDNIADQNEQGLRVFDPGFGNTCVSESKITFIDGLKGIIQYRGYDIGDLIEAKKGFVDTAHLLWFGTLPSPKEKQELQDRLNAVPLIDDHVFNTIRSFPKNGSPFGMIIAGLMALQSSEMDLIPAHAAKNIYLGNLSLVDSQLIRVMQSLSQICAVAYCHQTGRTFTPPRADLTFIENFLLMMGHTEAATGLPNPAYVAKFERLWLLIADHEMTCSTAAMLQTASAMPDALSCLASATSALYGPLHGGAIEVAYKNIAEIGSVDNIPPKIARVKAGKERLYGYGHRVYRVPDPRYRHIKEVLEDLTAEIEDDPLLKVAFELDRVARTDEYFTSRKLNPNADLFAALAYNAMGFEPEWILPISLMSRSQGLLAHWKEAMSGSARIWRPGQIYTGDLNKKIE